MQNGSKVALVGVVALCPQGRLRRIYSGSQTCDWYLSDPKTQRASTKISWHLWVDCSLVTTLASSLLFATVAISIWNLKHRSTAQKSRLSTWARVIAGLAKPKSVERPCTFRKSNLFLSKLKMKRADNWTKWPSEFCTETDKNEFACSSHLIAWFSGKEWAVKARTFCQREDSILLGMSNLSLRISNILSWIWIFGWWRSSISFSDVSAVAEIGLTWGKRAWSFRDGLSNSVELFRKSGRRALALEIRKEKSACGLRSSRLSQHSRAYLISDLFGCDKPYSFHH